MMGRMGQNAMQLRTGRGQDDTAHDTRRPMRTIKALLVTARWLTCLHVWCKITAWDSRASQRRHMETHGHPY